MRSLFILLALCCVVAVTSATSSEEEDAEGTAHYHHHRGLYGRRYSVTGRRVIFIRGGRVRISRTISARYGYIRYRGSRVRRKMYYMGRPRFCGGRPCCRNRCYVRYAYVRRRRVPVYCWTKRRTYGYVTRNGRRVRVVYVRRPHHFINHGRTIVLNGPAYRRYRGRMLHRSRGGVFRAGIRGCYYHGRFVRYGRYIRASRCNVCKCTQSGGFAHLKCHTSRACLLKNMQRPVGRGSAYGLTAEGCKYQGVTIPFGHAKTVSKCKRCACYGSVRSATVRCRIDSACLRGYCSYRGYKVPYGRAVVAGCRKCICLRIGGHSKMVCQTDSACMERMAGFMLSNPFGGRGSTTSSSSFGKAKRSNIVNLDNAKGKSSSGSSSSASHGGATISGNIVNLDGSSSGSSSSSSGTSSILTSGHSNIVKSGHVVDMSGGSSGSSGSSSGSSTRHCTYKGQKVAFYRSFRLDRCRVCTCMPQPRVMFFCRKTAACGGTGGSSVDSKVDRTDKVCHYKGTGYYKGEEIKVNNRRCKCTKVNGEPVIRCYRAGERRRQTSRIVRKGSRSDRARRRRARRRRNRRSRRSRSSSPDVFRNKYGCFYKGYFARYNRSIRLGRCHNCMCRKRPNKMFLCRKRAACGGSGSSSSSSSSSSGSRSVSQDKGTCTWRSVKYVVGQEFRLPNCRLCVCSRKNGSTVVRCHFDSDCQKGISKSSSGGNCHYNGKSYSIGSLFNLSACKNCVCTARNGKALILCRFNRNCLRDRHGRHTRHVHIIGGHAHDHGARAGSVHKPYLPDGSGRATSSIHHHQVHRGIHYGRHVHSSAGPIHHSQVHGHRGHHLHGHHAGSGGHYGEEGGTSESYAFGGRGGRGGHGGHGHGRGGHFGRGGGNFGQEQELHAGRGRVFRHDSVDAGPGHLKVVNVFHSSGAQIGATQHISHGEAIRQMLAHGRRGLGGHDFGASGRRGGAAAGSGRVRGGVGGGSAGHTHHLGQSGSGHKSSGHSGSGSSGAARGCTYKGHRVAFWKRVTIPTCRICICIPYPQPMFYCKKKPNCTSGSGSSGSSSGNTPLTGHGTSGTVRGPICTLRGRKFSQGAHIRIRKCTICTCSHNNGSAVFKCKQGCHKQSSPLIGSGFKGTNGANGCRFGGQRVTYGSKIAYGRCKQCTCVAGLSGPIFLCKAVSGCSGSTLPSGSTATITGNGDSNSATNIVGGGGTHGDGTTKDGSGPDSKKGTTVLVGKSRGCMYRGRLITFGNRITIPPCQKCKCVSQGGNPVFECVNSCKKSSSSDDDDDSSSKKSGSDDDDDDSSSSGNNDNLGDNRKGSRKNRFGLDKEGHGSGDVHTSRFGHYRHGSGGSSGRRGRRGRRGRGRRGRRGRGGRSGSGSGSSGKGGDDDVFEFADTVDGGVTDGRRDWSTSQDKQRNSPVTTDGITDGISMGVHSRPALGESSRRTIVHTHHGGFRSHAYGRVITHHHHQNVFHRGPGGKVRYVRYHGGYVIGEDRGDRACSYGAVVIPVGSRVFISNCKLCRCVRASHGHGPRLVCFWRHHCLRSGGPVAPGCHVRGVTVPRNGYYSVGRCRVCQCKYGFSGFHSGCRHDTGCDSGRARYVAIAHAPAEIPPEEYEEPAYQSGCKLSDGNVVRDGGEMVNHQSCKVCACHSGSFNCKRASCKAVQAVQGCFIGDKQVVQGSKIGRGCKRCTCNGSGIWICVMNNNCVRRFTRPSLNCYYKKQKILHNTKVNIGCETCSCNKGKSSCAKIDGCTVAKDGKVTIKKNKVVKKAAKKTKKKAAKKAKKAKKAVKKKAKKAKKAVKKAKKKAKKAKKKAAKKAKKKAKKANKAAKKKPKNPVFKKKG